MFKKDMVAVVKCDGKILREDGDMVSLPFNNEYSILIKNLRSKKALVSISIDGQDILNDGKLIIDGNSEIELERFVKDLDKGNKFKFIQKTQKIQENRGDKIDDGIIRIEFQFEKEIVETPIIKYSPIHFGDPFTPLHNSWTDSNWNTLDSTNFSGSMNSSNINSVVNTDNLNMPTFSAQNCSSSRSLGNTTLSNSISKSINLPMCDEGITTKGSVSNQKFKHGSVGVLENNSYVMTLKLKGFTQTGNIVNKPLTVKTPKICPICGTNNRNVNKYCKECGTFLD